MRRLVDKKRITSRKSVTGGLPGIEGDSQELERVVTNLVGDAVRPDQGEGKAFVIGGTEFRESPMGEATGRKRKHAPARAKQTLEFISFLTHELKTPLTSITASAGLLAEELALSPDDPKARLITNILASASNLEARASELLNLAKLEAEGFDLQLELTDISNVVHDVVEQISPIVRSRDQSLALNLAPGLPKIMADSVRIEQILLNLLSNAAKFSPEGGSISLTGGRQNGYIVIEVHNSGPSIPPEELQGIFQPYYRLKSADEEHVPGVGLGLALCRHLIELHGGEIWVESKQDKGNTFAFTLPIGAVTGEEAIRADESSLNHEPQIPDCEFQNPTKILVIEDNPQIVEAISLCFQLRCPEVSVVSATNGNTGIEMVETESPDMVIIDLGLPDIDGFDVLREIHSFSDVPTIMLTVRGDEIDKVKGLELGADDYIVKPFNHVELLARVKAVLRRTTMPQLKDAEEVVVSSELKIDFASSRLYRKGQTVKLTLNESSLLYHLVRNGGKTLSHRYLLERIWGEEHSDATEYLKVYVQRLRKKLEDDPSQPKMLTTQRGFGYSFIKPTQKTLAKDTSGGGQ